VSLVWLRVACVLVALSVLPACGDEPTSKSTVLEIGMPLETTLSLPTLNAPGEAVRVQGLLGTRATVFYAYSVPCPCVDIVEPRLRGLIGKYPPRQGVNWIAIAGEPLDTLEQLREKHLRLGATYRVLLDPQQQLCAQLGLRSACEVAVFNEHGHLVYRGGLDAELVAGHAEYLDQALQAVLTRKPLETPERPRVYGCYFDDPASCTQLGEPTDATPLR